MNTGPESNEDGHSESPTVVLEGVQRTYGATTVLCEVSFAARAGEVLALIGPSGAGKTTLLRCISGLEHIDRGRITVLDQLVNGPTDRNLRPPECRDIGFVFQSLQLWPHLTVRDNILEAPIRTGRLSRRNAQQKCEGLLKQFHLEKHADHYPYQLSGGEQQRTAIARTLAMDPKILLLDEITSALDPELVSDMLHVIAGLSNADRTLIVVTHEMKFARDIADRVLFLDHGRILEDMVAEEFFRYPKTDRARDFLQRISGVTVN